MAYVHGENILSPGHRLAGIQLIGVIPASVLGQPPRDIFNGPTLFTNWGNIIRG